MNVARRQLLWTKNHTYARGSFYRTTRGYRFVGKAVGHPSLEFTERSALAAVERAWPYLTTYGIVPDPKNYSRTLEEKLNIVEALVFAYRNLYT